MILYDNIKMLTNSFSREVVCKEYIYMRQISKYLGLKQTASYNLNNQLDILKLRALNIIYLWKYQGLR